MKKTGWMAFGLGLSLACLEGRAQGQSLSDLFSARATLSQAAIPLYTGSPPVPAGRLTAGRIHPSSQTRGFFHIGLFPVVAVEDVSFTLAPGATAQSAWGALSHVLSARQSKAVEMRRATLQLNRTYTVTASLVRCGAEAWEFSGDVRCSSAAQEWLARGGTLYFKAGLPVRLSLETTPPTTIDLTSLSL